VFDGGDGIAVLAANDAERERLGSGIVLQRGRKAFAQVVFHAAGIDRSDERLLAVQLPAEAGKFDQRRIAGHLRPGLVTRRVAAALDGIGGTDMKRVLEPFCRAPRLGAIEFDQHPRAALLGAVGSMADRLLDPVDHVGRQTAWAVRHTAALAAVSGWGTRCSRAGASPSAIVLVGSRIAQHDVFELSVGALFGKVGVVAEGFAVSVAALLL